MTKIANVLLIVAIPFMDGCAGETAPVPLVRPCHDFISGLKFVETRAPLKFDIEQSLGLKPDNFTSVYETISPLMSGCAPGDVNSVQPDEIKTHWDARPYVDVAAGIIDSTPWIQFIYPAVDEAGPGLASSIVFYGEDARPRATHLVSAYHAWENAITLRSTISSGIIQSCKQHIEHFSYKENGDMTEALDRPIRSECEASSSSYLIDECR